MKHERSGGTTFNLDASAYAILNALTERLAQETRLPVSIKIVIWASLVVWESGEVRPYGIMPVNPATQRLLTHVIQAAWEDERCA